MKGMNMGAKLQQELKKKRPFDCPEQEAALNITRTADRLQIQFTRLFRDYGVTGPQYNVLRILRGEGTPLPILEIASRMVTVVPGITGLIDRLEREGFVERVRCTEDRRVIYVALTEKGAAVLAELDEPVVALHRKLMGHMTAAELKELSRLLEKARAAMD